MNNTEPVVVTYKDYINALLPETPVLKAGMILVLLFVPGSLMLASLYIFLKKETTNS